MSDPRFYQRVNQPPPVEDADVAQWMRDVADALNALPPMSVFSFADPNSNVTAQVGTVGVSLAAASTSTVFWIKETGQGSTGWASLTTGTKA